MASGPASRSLKHLRDNGYTAQVVERWNQFARVRQDLFGCIDIVAIKSDLNGVYGVQTTSTGNMSARVEKIKQEPIMRLWLEAGNTLVVHGWAKRGKAGKRKLWTLKEREVTLKDLNGEVA